MSATAGQPTDGHDDKDKSLLLKEGDEAPQRPLDIERLRRCIIEFVHENFLEVVFWQMQTANKDFDEMLGVQAVVLLSKMDEKERGVLLMELVTIVHESSLQWRQEYERVVDAILYYAHAAGVLSINMCVEGLALTADFTLRTIMDPQKWIFIEENIPLMDYKGVRSLFKCLIYQQFNSIPAQLSPEQRRQLLPAERILLKILDPDLNVIPPIFTLTELSRGILKRAYMFPRLAHRLSELIMYFRAVAELSYVIGSHRAPYLPYKAELRAPQTYLLYTVIRQPRGKEVLSGLLRQVTHGRTQWDEILSVLISETMAEVQKLPEEIEIPRYQWENLMSIIMYGITQKHINLSRLLSLLSNVLVKTGYRRARDEVMWIMLQIAGTFQQHLQKEQVEEMARLYNVQKLPEEIEIPRYQWENLMSIIMYGITQKHINLSRLLSLLSNVLVKTGYRRARDEVMWIMLQIAGTFQQHLQKEQVEEMARLYNLLFNDDVVWTGASDHPSQLVRFLAAACMWNILDGSEGLPPPSECLANQIEFIRSNTGPPDEAMQAVLDNAFRHESPVSRNVHAIFQQRLDGQPTDEPHLLPYGRAANNKLDAFDMQFLDALTLRAKINLLLSTCFVSLHKVDRLPSPACVETCARILTSIEFDYGLTNFITILNRSITAALSPAPADGLSLKDQCYMLLDLLCYRLPSIPMNFRASMSHTHDPTPAGLRLCMTIHSAMAQQQIATNYGLYSAMEHTLMRQWAWNLLPDTISLAHLFVDNAFGNTLLNVNSWLVYNPMDNARAGRLVVCPEIVRMLLITMMRAMKIMGIESDPELMRINQAYTWAPSQLSSLPLTAQRTAITLEEDTAKAEAFQREVHTDFMQMRGQPEMSWMEYMSMPSRQPTILCVIFRYLIESPPEHQILSPVIYQILDRLTCREYVLAVNALTDYIISQCSAEKNSEEFLPMMIRVLNMMVFHRHVMTFDRLLLSLVLHPATDHASQIAMVIVQALLNCTEINERIDFYCRYIPRRDVDAPEHFRRLSEYHRKFPEMTFAEMANRPPMMAEMINPRAHYPIYYGSLIERLLPILDFTLARALELQVDNIFSTILTTCGPIYKFHPYPITFLYTILFCMHEQLGHHPRARQFVLAILCQGDQSSLTQSFINDNHQRVYSFEELVYELADRIITCSEFILTPPSYVAPDWRFAEYPPAAQALYLACIELLASPHSPEHIVPAMINLLVSSRAQPPRPYLMLNAIALLLTALPEAYCRVLQNEFLAVIDSGVLAGIVAFFLSCSLK
ncbi:hypothetical protein COOONC_03700 [Cooperia oncophora]